MRPNVQLLFDPGSAYEGLFVGNFGGLDMQGAAGAEILIGKWGTGNRMTGVRIAGDADYSSITMRHVRVIQGGQQDLFASINIAASIVLRGASGGTFENLSTQSPSGDWGLYFEDAIACPTMSSLQFLPPAGAGTECGTNSAVDCCAAAGI